MAGIERAALAALMLAASLAPAGAQDAAEGEVIARRWCAGCHVVARDQARGTTEAPTFPDIARSRSLNPDELAATLAQPHPVMDEVPLVRKTIEDLSAYFGALKGR